MADNELIKTSYRGVEITYLEDRNKWGFEVNGRERSAETPTKVRESIDRSLAQKTTDTWEPVEVWMHDGYRGGFKRVYITSLAEGRSRWDKSTYAWVTENGIRSKQSLAGLFAIDEANNSLIGEITDVEKQIEKLRGQLKDLTSKLRGVEFREDSDNEPARDAGA